MSSTEVAVKESTNGLVSREWVELMAPAVELAKHVVNTDFVPRGIRGNAPAIVAAIMYGDEVGLGPMQALAKIAVIDGKPSLAAEAQRALILAAGHEIWIEEASTTRVVMSGKRADSDRISTVTWTMDDAKRANLAGKPNYRAYPRQMLQARATAELARLIFADVIGGLAATEEIEDGIQLDMEQLEPAPEPSTKRKRKKTSAAVDEPAEVPMEPAESPAPELPPLPDEPLESGPTPSGPEEPGVPSDDSPVTPPVADEPPAAGVGNTVAASTRDKPATQAQKTKLDVLVGQLRDRMGVLTTEALYSTIAVDRNLWTKPEDPNEQPRPDLETLIAFTPDWTDKDGTIHLVRDGTGELHWAPLRETLTRAEANSWIDRLEGLSGRTPKAAP